MPRKVTALKGREGLLEKVRSLRTGWQQAGALPRDTARALTERYEHALGAIAANAPDTFRHTELDIAANRKQLEALCERVERLAGKETPAARRNRPPSCSRTSCARRWPRTPSAAV